MSWMKHTGCRYHTQDEWYYCGGAAAMMILAEIGVPYDDLDQDDLYDSNHDHNAKTGWYTDPYGLRYTLVDRRPAGFTNTFVVHAPTSEADGTRDIVYTLHQYNVSPAVLVFHCMHWIVVPGVQTDVEPVSGASYTVEGFWIHNPVHYEPPPPPPHSAVDACGSGGSPGTANDFVTYASWRSTYFTGCTYDDPAGAAQYISVCDPDVRDIERPRRQAREFPAAGRKLLTAAEAVRHSKAGLAQYRLDKDRRVATALRRARPGKPILVARLDRPNTYYHLVPWGTARSVAALTQVDARRGAFLSIHLQEKAGRPAMLTPDAVLKLVTHKRFELPDGLGKLRVFPEAICLSPMLVWQPCRESFSPHLPFYQLTVGGRKLYVRIDGKVFTRLTTTGRGM